MVKKFIYILFIALLTVTQKSYSMDVSGAGAAAAVTALETIQMDRIPIMTIDSHTMPKPINDQKVNYTAPLINPAEVKSNTELETDTTSKPTLNFNLGNLKNIKKGAILPKDNVNQTVSDIMQYYNAPYSKVFSHLLGIIDNSELEIVSYDSATGKIFANYEGKKPIYISVSQYNSSNVLVKITPADGVYDIPATITDKIFSELNRSLATK